MKAEQGHLDILVNNAGVLRDNLLFKMTEDDWDTVLNVHLKGAFLCSRAAQKYMVHQKYGRIVSLSSASALGNRGQANYSSAKAGLQGFTRTLAIELGPFGINVNSVAPGWVYTDMCADVFADESFRKSIEDSIPVGRVAAPEDIGWPIVFLCTEWARHINGEILNVNGGSGLCG